MSSTRKRPPASAPRTPVRLCALLLASAACSAAATRSWAQIVPDDADPEDVEAAVQAALAAARAGSAVQPPAGEPAPGADAPQPAGAGGFSKDEIAEMRAAYEGADAGRRAQLKAYYKDLGVELEAVIGVSARAARDTSRAQEISRALREGRSPRTPQAMLAARTRLSRPGAYPDASAGSPQSIASWVHERVVAGAWDQIREFVRPMPAVQSDAIFSALLEWLQQSDPSKGGDVGVLPEEVVDIAMISPAELTPRQIVSLSAILRASAARNGTDAFLARVHANDGPFGDSDQARRRRTLTLLSNAGMDKDAFAFLPPLDAARAAGDPFAILVRARYLQDRAGSIRDGEEAQADRAQAWALFGEVARHPSTPAAERADAVARAVKIMRRLPRAQVEPWLREIFDDEQLGPLAMEKIAIDADGLAQEPLERDERTRAIVTLKEAVDVLLDSRARQSERMAVPLRILTAAIANQLELAVAKRPERYGSNRVNADLLRAIPGTDWLDKVEASLAARTAAASAALLAKADQTDRAIDVLIDAARRTPTQAARAADQMFDQWISRLRGERDDDEFSWRSWRYYSYYASPVITRGMQRRNLDRLRNVIVALNAAHVKTEQMPKLAEVFAAAHNSTEVYEMEDLVAVFGPVESIDATTARALAEQISNRVDAYWRERLQKSTAQAATPGAAGAPAAPGQKKPQVSNAELIQVVDRGFRTAHELAARARAAAPDSWQTAQMNASVEFRWLAFNLKTGKTDDAARLERLRDVYASLEHAASLYQAALASGTERESPDLFIAWFRLAIGAADVSLLHLDDLPAEGTLQDNQFARISAAINRLPPDIAYRHLTEIATQLDDAVNGLAPEVKPRFVKCALRVIGDHPAGAALRARQSLYSELARDEIKLTLSVDGATEIRPGQPFGVAVSLRVTSAVERESGGFDQYLRNNVQIGGWGSNSRQMNYRDMLQKTLEEAFGRHFDVETIGFFDPLFPSRGVIEHGQDGWVEKPLAYLVVAAKDKTVDRLPQVTMEMQFTDVRGEVNVVVASSTPPIAVSDAAGPRPLEHLEITQRLDDRDAEAGSNDGTIRLEIVARARGSVPGVESLLVGLDSAIRGYQLAPESTKPKSTVMLSEAEFSNSGPGGSRAPTYPEPNAAGIIQPVIERTWTLEYKPVDRSIAGTFTVPTLAAGLDAKLVSERYGELEPLPIATPTVRLGVTTTPWRTIAIGGAAAAALIAGAWWLVKRRRSGVRPAAAIVLPERVTPLSTLVLLRRWHDDTGTALSEALRAELLRDIATLESAYFGPGGGAEAPDLTVAIKRWAARVGP